MFNTMAHFNNKNTTPIQDNFNKLNKNEIQQKLPIGLQGELEDIKNENEFDNEQLDEIAEPITFNDYIKK